MLTVREMGGGGVKVIWWFVAVVDEEPDGNGSVPVEAGECDFLGLSSLRLRRLWGSCRSGMIGMFWRGRLLWSRIRDQVTHRDHPHDF